jgi:hypothetical protein
MPDQLHPSQLSRTSYLPSPEKDKEHLVQWSSGLMEEPRVNSLSPIARRYLKALTLMTQEERDVFLIVWLLASGHSLPPFPDQE